MTKAEEANMWERLVSLEEKVDELMRITAISRRAVPRIEETPPGRPLEPPRDRYGADVGRPEND